MLGARRDGCELGIGAGIAQGYATLGQIGFSERSGYTAFGTVCNLAARLCAEAKDARSGGCARRCTLTWPAGGSAGRARRRSARPLDLLKEPPRPLSGERPVAASVRERAAALHRRGVSRR